MKDVLDRFHGHVDKTLESPCWRWTGPLNNKGYGVFSIYVDGKRHTYMAHRIACMLDQGTLPENAHVCHRCDNPACVNPAHLFVGDNSINMLDALQKSRARPGGRVPVLDPHKVGEIRAMGRSGAYTAKEIARVFGVGEHVVRKVLNGDTWKHI